MKKSSVLLILIVLLSAEITAQKRIIFSPEMEPPSYLRKDTSLNSVKYIRIKDLDNGVGFKMFATSYGFGLGGFYRKQFDEETAYQLEFEITPGKSDREFERFNYFGQSTTVGKVNSLLLMPLTNSIYYRLFKDDILDNFRPFLTAGAGMVFAYQYPYDPNDGLSGFGRGIWKLGVTSAFGFGADFGSNYTLIQGVSLRYTIHYLPDAAELMIDPNSTLSNIFLKKDFVFQGFQLSLNLGKMWTK